MKKISLILIFVLLLLSLAGCVTVQKNVELSQDGKNIQSIEIYTPERGYSEGDIHVFLKENEPIAVVETEAYSDFLVALCNLAFEEENLFFPIPMDGGCDYEGYIVAIVYADGGYDIVAEGGLYSYAVGEDGQGKHKYDHSDYCGKTPWSDFIEEYIEK